MIPRCWSIPLVAAVALGFLSLVSRMPACAPAWPSGKPVVNADQTVILIWDQDTKTQHFIRKASFKSDADDFGFLVPTPTQPELSESGNQAFPFLQKITEPEVRQAPRSSGMSCIGCGDKSTGTRGAAGSTVRVLEEKLVAGFHAAVLEADSADALVKWLASNAYMFSPELKAWAKPYVESGWKITALKVAKPADAKEKKSVTASSLRITFKTDRPVFPYREPNPEKAATDLGAHDRLLRIYFLADARYAGSLDGRPWTGKVAWAGPIKDEDRAKTLEHLNLPSTTGPAKWWLTEFEEHWPYQSAPADVYFSRSGDQSTVVRPPIIQYIWSPWTADGMIYALAAVVVGPPLLRRLRRDKKR